MNDTEAKRNVSIEIYQENLAATKTHSANKEEEELRNETKRNARDNHTQREKMEFHLSDRKLLLGCNLSAMRVS